MSAPMALPKPPAVPSVSPPRRISWLLCVPAVLIAACVLVGARLFLDAASLSPKVLYSRVISSASLCAAGVPAGGVALEPWRATAQLNATRWQYVNVSLGAFPDGSPIKHYLSAQANIWGLAASQSWEAETFKVIRTVLTRARAARLAAWQPLDPASPRPSALKMLDIGGWIGVTGLYGAQFLTEVHAFEPDPAARSELVANVALNPLFEQRLRVHPLCLSHADEEVTMKGDPGGSWSSVLFFDDKGTLPKWTISCRRFAPTLRELGIAPADVALIKMDVEGVEHTLLPAMHKWLVKAGRPPVWLSMHVWLWQDRPRSDAAVLTVFRDYAAAGRVYDAALKRVAAEELTDSYFADKAQPAYLLTGAGEEGDFGSLDARQFERQGGPLPDLRELERALLEEARADAAAGGSGGLRRRKEAVAAAAAVAGVKAAAPAANGQGEQQQEQQQQASAEEEEEEEEEEGEEGEALEGEDEASAAAEGEEEQAEEAPAAAAPPPPAAAKEPPADGAAEAAAGADGAEEAAADGAEETDADDGGAEEEEEEVAP